MSCAHDHDCGEADCGPAWSLHRRIDLSQVWALNASEEAGAGRVQDVLRAWDARLDRNSPPLESNEDDPELLIHIGFEGHVKLKAICIIGGTDGTAPSHLRAFTNREGLDFGAVAELPPVQAWDLQEDPRGVLEYPTQVQKFGGVHCLDLHIPRCFGADRTRIHFLGLKGEFTEAKREAVVAVYEAKPLPADHKVPGGLQASHDLIS